MSPLKQSTTQQSPPTADDLLFLLSIVSNPNSFIAEHHKTKTQPTATANVQNTKFSGDVIGKSVVVDNTSTSSSWQQTLTSLPIRRRQIILTLQRLANARQKWKDYLSSKNAQEKESNDFGRRMDDSFQIEADALEEVEHAASAIRMCATEYLESVKGYKTSLQLFWIEPITVTHAIKHDNHNYSELAHIGSQLTSQLICQLQWDERLALAILTFLEKELYISNTNTNEKNHSSQLLNDQNATEEKLRAWADAMSQMIKINKSFWEFVEREVYDETELEMEKEVPEFLNGEPSTQILPIGPSTESGKNHQENMIGQSTSENSGIEQDSLHERIVSSSSVEEAIETFMHGKCQRKKENDGRFPHYDFQQQSRSITSILLVGEEGCGKTHLLDSIKQHASNTKFNKSSVKVLRPKYPVDLVGNSIGSSEDRLIALFTYASRIISTASENGPSKCLIMLDDIDQMFSLSNDINEESSGAAGSSTQFYVGRRCKALFLTILDSFREYWPSSVKGGHLLILCTSRSRCGEVVDRFDRTFRRGQPNEKQRRQLITSCLSIGIADDVDNTAENDDSGVEAILSLIVHHSTGRSVFELSQCCREALLSCAKSASSDKERNSIIFLHRLQCLDKMLQTKSPQSLRGGLLDGIVDMRVYTPKELQSKLTTDANGTVKMPLLGAEANRAYEALMNVVITPLCRSDEIRNLLYGGSGSGQGVVVDAKPIRVGALLAGAPGVGKTSLAYHCASLAAKLARVSLLDVSCTSLIHKEIGGSERAVQRLFAAVRAAAPCVLLLDGIENVARRRGNDNTSEGTMDRVLSTFLTEMDGIETGSDGASGNVAVIGVTHNPDLIDPSLLRPGRLEKTITLGAPDFLALKEIIAGQIKDIDMDFSSAGYFEPKNKDDVSSFVAMESAGMSAVEVIAICREASMECLRELNFEVTKKPTLTYEHFKRGKKNRAG